jgi:hypothetical protein
MSLQPFTSWQRFAAGPVLPLVSCESCSSPMRLTLVAPLWDSRDAERHTYECGCCRHRQSFRLLLKQYPAVVAAQKTAIQVRGEPRELRTVGRIGKGVERGVCRIYESQATVTSERSLEVSGLQAVTRYARSIA